MTTIKVFYQLCGTVYVDTYTGDSISHHIDNNELIVNYLIPYVAREEVVRYSTFSKVVKHDDRYKFKVTTERVDTL